MKSEMSTRQAVLETTFTCYGHFYTIVDGERLYPCRSVLEIVSNRLGIDSPDLLSSKIPNAIVIMMNPGSSTPARVQNIRVNKDDVCLMEIPLVLANPDDTQFQIMRIMEFMKWQHIRILNLSDLRDSVSGSFYEFFPRVESETKSDLHSIFSEKRNSELERKLSTTTPIIAAWGVSSELDTLINKCINGVGGNFVGVRKEGCVNKYYHPLLRGKPMNQNEWLHKICEELSGVSI